MNGRITVDDIVDVIKEEATEDIERMAGLVGTEDLSSSVFRTSRIRLPWLILGFIGGILSAVVFTVSISAAMIPPAESSGAAA